VGAEVIVTAVPGFVRLQCLFDLLFMTYVLSIIRTGSIASRSENLDRVLQDKAVGRGVNFLAHSMGGLDCKQIVVEAYT
jgi:hypothetical protein